MASDGNYILAEVSRNSLIDVEVEIKQSILSYLDDLDQELSSQPWFKKPPTRTVTKKITKSTTEPKCGDIHHGSNRGMGYLRKQHFFWSGCRDLNPGPLGPETH